MNAEEARQIIKNAWPTLAMNPIQPGLNILTKYDPQLEQDIHGGQIFAGDFESIVEKMSEKDIERMAELGWYEDEESWSHNC